MSILIYIFLNNIDLEFNLCAHVRLISPEVVKRLNTLLVSYLAMIWENIN